MCPWLARPSQGKLPLLSRHLHPHPWMRTTWSSSSPKAEGCITSFAALDIQSCELPWHEAQVAGYKICKGDLCIFQSIIHYLIESQHKIICLCIFNKQFLAPLLHRLKDYRWLLCWDSHVKRNKGYSSKSFWRMARIGHHIETHNKPFTARPLLTACGHKVYNIVDPSPDPTKLLPPATLCHSFRVTGLFQPQVRRRFIKGQLEWSS